MRGLDVSVLVYAHRSDTEDHGELHTWLDVARQGEEPLGVRDIVTAVQMRPGARHWDIFQRLCTTTGARGNHVPDAFLAALAIESNAAWVTADRGFARYPGLRWAHPLDP